MRLIFLTCLFISKSFFISAELPFPEKFIYYPHPSYKKFNCSAGLIFTTLHQDITEETLFRVPAIDFHFLQKIFHEFSFVGRINSQILQHHFSGGIRWTHPIGNRLSFAIGNDIAYWTGKLKIEGFDTKASGWNDYPNISLGMRCGSDVLVTLKAEAILQLSHTSFVGTNRVSFEKYFYNG